MLYKGFFKSGIFIYLLGRTFIRRSKNMLKQFNILNLKENLNLNIDILYCGNCDKDTTQKVFDSGHERDSSHDRFECTECGFVKYGITGTWEKY